MSRTTAYFRDLNDRIVRAAEQLDFEGFVPLVCECPSERCFRLVRTTLDEYRAIRKHAERLVLYPGHEDVHADERPVGLVRHDAGVGGVAPTLDEDRRLGVDVEGEDRQRRHGAPASARSASSSHATFAAASAVC